MFLVLETKEFEQIL